MIYILKKIFRFFDKLEDNVRGTLSKYPIIYACIGGLSIVLFWRGVWHTADILMQKGGIFGVIFYEPITVLWTSIIMLMSGLFVSFFIGERIVISCLKHDKKVFEINSLLLSSVLNFLTFFSLTTLPPKVMPPDKQASKQL